MTVIPRRVPGEALLEDRGPHYREPGPFVGAPPPTASGGDEPAPPRIGVLALQGDVLEHLRLLGRAGAMGVAVHGPSDLDGLDGLVLPGGESTTIGKLCALCGLDGPLRDLIADGFPVLGTCAGAILLSRQALRHDGTPSDQELLGGMDTVVRRNAFGRQVASFEADIGVKGLSSPMHAAFIRAPWFEETGEGVEVLATVATPVGDRVVLVRQGSLLASAFHPELSGDPRLHRLFVETVLPHPVP